MILNAAVGTYAHICCMEQERLGIVISARLAREKYVSITTNFSHTHGSRNRSSLQFGPVKRNRSMQHMIWKPKSITYLKQN